MAFPPPTVLVVDDEGYFAAAFAQSLQEEAGERLHIDFVTTPDELLARVAEQGPDIAAVVSDYDLKARLTGLALLAEVRRESAHTKRVLVTGHELERFAGEPEFGLLDGAFEKPQRFEDITRSIVKLILDHDRRAHLVAQ